MHWGHKIILSFVFFGAFIITLVVVCVKQDYHLVSEDYYQQELQYEDQMTKERNVLSLTAPPEMEYQSGKQQLVVAFPGDIKDQILDGEVVFFRPSNAQQDFTTPLRLDNDGHQLVDLSQKEQGIWYVELNWKDRNKEYSIEKRIYL